ncbi:hypothetical protein C2G38_2036014 [Gigaspora rosea]|uniref:Uncharacterized protein n=1 Tax=Gigaspora rosea TaxID=44941 RepID=A0A397VDT9_9GLOM|nr:hypothetical protein C2G38_2036014 [Gigaspora rosea]
MANNESEVPLKGKVLCHTCKLWLRKVEEFRRKDQRNEEGNPKKQTRVKHAEIEEMSKVRRNKQKLEHSTSPAEKAALHLQIRNETVIFDPSRTNFVGLGWKFTFFFDKKKIPKKERN